MGDISDTRKLKKMGRTYAYSLPSHTVRAMHWEVGDDITAHADPEHKAIVLINNRPDASAFTKEQYAANLVDEVYKSDPKKREKFMWQHLTPLEFISWQNLYGSEVLMQKLKGRSRRAMKQILAREGWKLELYGPEEAGKGFKSLTRDTPEARRLLAEDAKISDEEYARKELEEEKKHLEFDKKQRESELEVIESRLNYLRQKDHEVKGTARPLKTKRVSLRPERMNPPSRRPTTNTNLPTRN